LGDRKGIRPVKTTATTAFLVHNDSMVASSHVPDPSRGGQKGRGKRGEDIKGKERET